MEVEYKPCIRFMAYTQENTKGKPVKMLMFQPCMQTTGCIMTVIIHMLAYDTCVTCY